MEERANTVLSASISQNQWWGSSHSVKLSRSHCALNDLEKGYKLC